MNHAENIRLAASEVAKPGPLLDAADYIDHLEAQVRERGCKECADRGHHPHCDSYIPSIGELLGDY